MIQNILLVERLQLNCFNAPHHRLRGRASPVLTAKHHSYGSRRLSDFFSISALRVRPLNGHSRKMAQTTCFHARMCLCGKSRYFSYPLISRSQKVKILQIIGLRKFLLDLAFNIRGHGENTPYSSSEPNESDIVNRQSGGEKLKYILKFYIVGSCHLISPMRNDDLALCLWAHDYITLHYIEIFNVA